MVDAYEEILIFKIVKAGEYIKEITVYVKISINIIMMVVFK